MLIRDGAELVRSSTDVLMALKLDEGAKPHADDPALAVATPKPQRRTLRETAELHQQILNRLGPSPLAEDQSIRDLSAAAADIGPALVDLKLEGQIRRQAGGLLARVV